MRLSVADGYGCTQRRFVWDSPAGFGDDHFGTQVAELVPQILIFQVAFNASQFFTVASRL